jgi:hypothetical protein
VFAFSWASLLLSFASPVPSASRIADPYASYWGVGIRPFPKKVGIFIPGHTMPHTVLIIFNLEKNLQKW